jgi:hypothetical protein
LCSHQTGAEADGLIIQPEGASALLWTKYFLVGGSAGEGRLIGFHGPDVRGYIKGIVRSETAEEYLPDLCRRTSVAIAAVPVDLPYRVWGEVEFRFDVCMAVSSIHIEFQ